MDTKAALRAHFTALRLAVPKNDRHARNLALADQLYSAVDWQHVGSMHTYKAREDWGELSPAPGLVKVLKQWPGIVVVEADMAAEAPLPEKLFDVIIVPVLACDGENYRLGMGKGWYDRFLATQPQAHTIGLAYKEAQLPILPREPHDIALDTILHG